MHKAQKKRIKLIEESQKKGTQLENEEVDIDNILARNDELLWQDKYVSFCSELVQQIDEFDFKGFLILEEFKERLNQEIGYIQNQEEYQKFARVYMYQKEKNKLLNA